MTYARRSQQDDVAALLDAKRRGRVLGHLLGSSRRLVAFGKVTELNMLTEQALAEVDHRGCRDHCQWAGPLGHHSPGIGSGSSRSLDPRLACSASGRESGDVGT